MSVENFLTFTSWSLFGIAFSMTLITDWRILLALLVLQYGGVMILIAESWPVTIAGVKLLAGLLSAGVLALTLGSISEEAFLTTSLGFPERVFRGLSALLVGISVISFFEVAQNWFLGASPSQINGGLFLLGLGLIQVSLSERPLRVVIGLLTVISGFEILYATVEGSILMTAFLGVVTLGFALVGAYLILVMMEVNPE